MKRCLLFVNLAMLILLGGCAQNAIAQAELAPKQEQWIDKSNPSLPSMYYFLSGSYLEFAGDLAVANQVYNMAMAHDLKSPQIHKACFMSGMRYFSVLVQQEGPERLVDLLKEAREGFQFDEEMLVEAYRAYEKLNDAEGCTWALNELNTRFPGAWASYYTYTYATGRGEAADTALLDEALSLNRDDTRFAQLIALAWLGKDDDKALEILKKLPPDTLNETLLLSIMDSKEEDLAQERFAGYRYPQDRTSMLSYIIYYSQKHEPGNIFAFKEKITATDDAVLVFSLANLALLYGNSDVYEYLLHSFSNKRIQPEQDSMAASALLLHAVKLGDKAAAREMAELIYCTAHLNQALFTTILNADQSPEELQASRESFSEKLKQNLAEGTLRDYLLFILNEDASKRDAAPVLNYARSLWNKGYADKEDFTIILDDLARNGDEEAQVLHLREGLKRWPWDAMFMNNLGYLLLSDSSKLDEAERLISQALQIEPNSISFLDSMAWLYYRKGDYARAAKLLPQIEASSLKSAELFYHMGMIYLAINEPDKARMHLENAVAAEEPAHYVKLAKEQLDLLK